MKSNESRLHLASMAWLISVIAVPIFSGMARGDLGIALQFISLLGWFVTSVYIGHLKDEIAKESKTRSSGCFITFALFFAGVFLYLIVGVMYGCSPF
jgi:hypothetical protein